MKKVVAITLTILAVVLVVACALFFAPAFTPDRESPGFTLPKADIIYQALNNQVSMQNESNNLIGFVNADGSGNTLVKLKYRAYQPVFSLEAGGLFFHDNESDPYGLMPEGGQPYFLSKSGVYKICTQFYVEGFIFPVEGTGYYLLESDGGNIELADMKTCKVIKRLVEIPNPGGVNGEINSAYPSSSGKSMVFSESSSAQGDVIYIMDIGTGAVREVLQGGYNASFSPDNQRIAYVGDNGIYIANADGTGSKLIVKIDFNSYSESAYIYSDSVETPYPFWSSDGSTLVYHKCNNEDCHDLSNFSIYKVDVNSGVEQKIVDGGLYPIWIK